MENSFRSLTDSAASVLVLIPQKPFFDQVAAGLALYLSLKEAGKDVTISCSSPMLVEFNRLVGVNKITSELGNKNLTISFVDYEATNIERVSYDIENGEFKLSVIPKPGATPPQKDQIVMNYSGVAADTVIMVGGVNEAHYPQLASEELVGTKLVHVGTKSLSVAKDKEVMSFARPASSVSEIIASLIKESGLPLDSDIATNLVMGTEEGSNNFTNQETTAGTFETFAELLRAGGQRVLGKNLQKESFPTGSIPGSEVEIENKEEAPKEWLGPKVYKGTSIS